MATVNNEPLFHPLEPLTGSPAIMLPWVFGYFAGRYGKPIGSAVDIGCNVGEWLSAAQKFGAKRILGIDAEPTVIDKLQFNDKYFRLADLRMPLLPPGGEKFDLAICLEVAEHLEEDCADALVSTCCAMSDFVLWSAAVPGQGGFRHVNCQPLDYWANRFARHNHLFLDAASKQHWPSNIKSYYRENIALFIKSTP